MEQLFATLGYVLTALVAVAALIALVEHLHREAEAPPAEPTAPPRAASVDVNLTLLAASPEGDQQTRQATVVTAVNRMAHPAPAGWTETRPMVSAGAASEPESR